MISVDRLQPSDRPVWEELFRGYSEFYGQRLDPDVAARAWGAFAADTEMHALGARLDGHLVGLAHFLVHPSTTGPDVCYLEDLFTAADVRGEGVGRALIAAVARWAGDHQCSRVYWQTRESNESARRLYDQVAVNSGFIVYTLRL